MLIHVKNSIENNISDKIFIESLIKEAAINGIRVLVFLSEAGVKILTDRSFIRKIMQDINEDGSETINDKQAKSSIINVFIHMDHAIAQIPAKILLRTAGDPSFSDTYGINGQSNGRILLINNKYYYKLLSTAISDSKCRYITV